jgi:hypothetical protein
MKAAPGPAYLPEVAGPSIALTIDLWYKYLYYFTGRGFSLPRAELLSLSDI